MGLYEEKLSDVELALLNQLAYLDEYVAEAADIFGRFMKIHSENKTYTVGDILSCFDEKALKKLSNEESMLPESFISGKEWADIIRCIQNSERLSNLVLTEVETLDSLYCSCVYDPKKEKYMMIEDYRDKYEDADVYEDETHPIIRTPINFCFTYPDGERPDEAIVLFRGTSGVEEWEDDVRAANRLDTAIQRNANDFVNEIVERGYDEITVTGHSKGGNKSMYVAIVNENVVRCVSFDGQGMSENFHREYFNEILSRSELIKNYSASSDFVHILLFQFPGSEQIYCHPYGLGPAIDQSGILLDGVGNPLENHAANSMFIAVDGKLALDSNGLPQFDFEPEGSALTQITGLVKFLLSNADYIGDEIEYLANLLPYTIVRQNDNGYEVTEVDLFVALAKRSDCLVNLLASVVYYAKENSLDRRFVFDAVEQLVLMGRDFTLGKKAIELCIDYIEALAAMAIDMAEGIAENVSIDPTYAYATLQTLIDFYDLNFDFKRLFIFDSDGRKANDIFVESLHKIIDSIFFDFKESYSNVVQLNKDKETKKEICNFLESEMTKTIIKDSSMLQNLIDEKDSLTYKEFKQKVIELIETSGYAIEIGTVNSNIIEADLKRHTVIFAGEDDDIIYGHDKKDYIFAGNGDDIIAGGSGDDTIYADKYKENIVGGDDLIYGGSGDDTIYAGAGDDKVYGESGDDTIDGGAGNDEIYGGDGDDEIYGRAGNDEIDGGSGDDTIDGGAENDIIDGNYGNDTIFGRTGNDTLDGGSGNDKIRGGLDNDTINGGSGTDYLYGEEGNDTYIFEKILYSSQLQGHTIEDYDIVSDKYGQNTVWFKEVPDDIDEFNKIIEFTKGDNPDTLVIRSRQTGVSMEIVNYFKNEEHYRFRVDHRTMTYTLNDDLILEEKPWGIPDSRDTALGHLIDDSTDNLIGDYEKASQAQPPRDPLVIHLNGGAGVEHIPIDDEHQAVYFDLDKNGFAERTAWIGSNDGFLALDRNGNGTIDDGGELFSDRVTLKNGEESGSGFVALKDLDDNNDGVIDEKDSAFKELTVWIDANQDGKSEGELHSLEELGIKSISLDHTEITDPEHEFGVTVTEISTVTFADGRTTSISENWFDVLTFDTVEVNMFGDGTYALSSFGNLMSIDNALANDEMGVLAEMLEKFNNSDDYVEKRILTKKILYFISGATDIKADSRGSTMDARDLHVIETIMGVDSFIGAGGEANPNSNAAAILKNLYAKFEELYFLILNSECDTTEDFDIIGEVLDENGNIVLDMDIINKYFKDRANTDGSADDVICSLCSYLRVYDNAHKTNYLRQFRNENPEAAESIDKYLGLTIILGTDEKDTLNGTSSNELFWAENGDDIINASSGNDIIYGENGNDTINAGNGNDIVYGDDGNDIIDGGYGDDTIYGGNDDDTINGDNGNDTLYGENGNDTINGEKGNDTIYGGDGDDVINGGLGDDVIHGGDGNDTYYINENHGNDIIYDSEGRNTIIFSDDILAEDYNITVDINGGFILTHKKTGETVSLPDFIKNPLLYDFQFADENGVLGGGDSQSVVEGTDDNDKISVSGGFNIIYGYDNDDIINGGENLDFIYGGNGNDTIHGGNGLNIIFGEDGDDTITDGKGDSYLDGGNGNDTIFGGFGNDVIIGGSGDDELHGEDGNDVIAGNDGDDLLYGEDGNDTLYADAGNDELHGGNGNDSLFGGDSDDILYGDSGDDYLEAGNGTDTLYGGIGNDTFVGGEGINYMYGEDGDDTFYGGNAMNYMYGGDGNDNFTGGELADYIEGGAGNDTMNGGNGNNEMYGGDGEDYIYGGNDDDYIEGGSGDDHLYGGNGLNTIYGNEGNDTIYSGSDGSFLYGGDGNDWIYAGGGDDVLDGGAGNDYLQGDHGGDTYIFGIGYDIDTISASADTNIIMIHGYTVDDMHNTRESNNDLIIDFGENSGDRLIVTGFFNYNSNRDFNFLFDDETVLGQYDIQAASAPISGTDADEWLNVQGNDGGVIHAGAGNDGLSGGSGNDELYGEDGDDTLYGNDGDDLMDGGAGNDQLNGGNGTDTYIFAKGYGNDTINEWGNDHSIVKLTDVNSDDVTITDQWGSNMILTINSTGDTLTISNFKWGQCTCSFEFVDGAVASVNKDTWELEFSKMPDIPETGEDDIVQENSDILSELYLDDSLNSDILTETDSTVISDISDSTSVTDESNEIADQTDIQVMILTENMSAFASEDNVFDNADVLNSTDDMSIMNQLIVGSQVQ